MPVTDPIGDMLAVLKNGIRTRKETVEIKQSKLHKSIMEIMKREGFITNYKPIDDKKQGLLKVYLKYEKDSVPAITGVKRISTPGRRVYVKNKKIKDVYGGLGVALISTSEGILTDKEAKEKKLGGEILCHIW